MIELATDSVVPYLRERGVIPADTGATAEELGWGISNLVCKVSWAERVIVVKQSLPQLRVAQEWHFDRSRVLVEYDCMRYLGGILPAGSVPDVVFTDPDNFVFAMTCAPAGGRLWKQALLAGDIDPAAAQRAGALLRRVHATSAGQPEVARRFGDQTVLVQGRIDPYHRTAAAANPDVAALIHAEVDRLLRTRQALVLGDFSPKNTFIYPDGVFIIDFEVAHWGDPAFDVAFCLTHLVLKACRFPERAADYLRAAGRFLTGYGDQPGPGTVAELGCLLLARVDGKSRVEYLTDEESRSFVRRLAKEILYERTAHVDQALKLVAQRLGVTP